MIANMIVNKAVMKKICLVGTTTASTLYSQTSAEGHYRSDDPHPSAFACRDGSQIACRDNSQAVEKFSYDSCGIDTDYDTNGFNSFASKFADSSELTRIVDYLSADTSLLNSLFPLNLPAVDRDLALKSIFRTVRKVIDDPDLLADITACESKRETNLSRNDSMTGVEDPISMWNELVNDHKCIICSDLLACPVILGCSHSFCGSCVTEMREAWETDGLDMVYTCPTCRNEIETEIFERVLDNIIVQKVDQIPDCEAKKDWVKRRESYLKSRRARSLEKELQKEDSASPEYVIVAIIVIITVALATLRCLRGM